MAASLRSSGRLSTDVARTGLTLHQLAQQLLGSLPSNWRLINSKVHCDIVIQYMCEDANPELRDGTPKDLNDAATDRVPDNEEESKDKVPAQPAMSYALCTSDD